MTRLLVGITADRAHKEQMKEFRTEIFSMCFVNFTGVTGEIRAKRPDRKGLDRSQAESSRGEGTEQLGSDKPDNSARARILISNDRACLVLDCPPPRR